MTFMDILLKLSWFTLSMLLQYCVALEIKIKTVKALGSYFGFVKANMSFNFNPIHLILTLFI